MIENLFIPLHTLQPMHVLCTTFLYVVPSWLKFIFFCTTFIAKKYSFSKNEQFIISQYLFFLPSFHVSHVLKKTYKDMKNRKSISQAIIIRCCYKRYTAGSYAAENKSNVKMLQDKNKCDEATQKLCQVSYVYFEICKRKTGYL